MTGPGNIYVVAAKRLLKGLIGIDSEAGPTEIAVLADDSADPVHVAADLISQSEHDVLAASVLVTDSEPLAAAVQQALEVRVAATKHHERVRTSLTSRQSGIVLVDDVEAGLKVVNAYAAEHLEIQTRDASAVAARVTNGGAVFVGPFAPVSLGDYCAGSNHVLPTGGCATHSSGLSVQSFLRGIHVVQYDERGPARGGPARRHPGRRRGPPGARRGRDGPRRRRLVSALDQLLRPDLRGRTAYGAPQLDVPVRLNTNENSYDVPAEVVDAVVAGVAEVGRQPQPLPRPRVHRPARGPGRLPRATSGSRSPGPGVGRQRLQRGAAAPAAGLRRPGTHGAGVHPGVLDAPDHHPHGRHHLGRRPRGAGGRFDLDPDGVAAQVAEHRPHLVFLCSPNNPTGTALGLDVVQAAYEAAPDAIVVVDEAYAEFARPAPRAR